MPEHALKGQLARELCALLDGCPRDIGAAQIGAAPSEISRLRHGDLRRFSIARLLQYIARAGYDIEIQLKRRPRLAQRPRPPRPSSSVVRYDYYGQVVSNSLADRT